MKIEKLKNTIFEIGENKSTEWCEPVVEDYEKL